MLYFEPFAAGELMKWLFSVPGGSFLCVDEIEFARGEVNRSEFVLAYG